VSDRKSYVIDLLLFTVVIAWGFNFSVLKLAYRSFHPITFNALRFLAASAAMALVLKFQGKTVRIEKRDMGNILWLGFLGNTVYPFIFVLGLDRTKAGNAALFMALTPIFAYVAGVFSKRERFSSAVFGGILVSLAGVTTIVFFGAEKLTFGGTWRGDLMMIVSAFFWGWYSAESTRLLPKYGAIVLTVTAMVAGTAIMIPFSLPWLLTQNWSAVSAGAWLGLAFSSLLSLAYAYFIWAYALSHVGVARTAVYANVTPIIALIAGWMLLGEHPTGIQLAGMVLVLAGVFMVRSRKPLAIPPE
jgi:drug/metabolite transporter (DMT)-like permease